MKKKNYLHEVEKGVLIGTSALLLSGMTSCSDEPTDTMPENFLTKGASGIPGQPGVGFPSGPPGRPDWRPDVPMFPLGTVPTLTPKNTYCFNMKEGSCTFNTVLTKGFHDLEIHIVRLSDNETVRRVAVGHVKSFIGMHNIEQRQDDYILKIAEIKPKSLNNNWTDSVPNSNMPFPDRNLEIEVRLTSTTTTPFYFSIVPINLPNYFRPDYPNGWRD